MDKRQLNNWLRKNVFYKGPSTTKWEGKVGSLKICFWADPAADRIRIHAQICDAGDISHKDLLSANFHSTQDVHYAIHQGKLHAVYTHWFRRLTIKEFDRAFDQILQLAQNTLRGDYCSGDMVLYYAYKAYKKESVTKNKVKEQWRRVSGESDSRKKGKGFEKFVNLLLQLDQGFRKTKSNVRTLNEEIDILVTYKGNSSHWIRYASPFIMVECRNKNEKVQAKEIREFVQKMRNHQNMTTLGFFFSRSGFTRGCFIELVRLSNTQFNLALIDGDMIDTFLKKKNQDLKDFLERAIVKSMK